MGWVPGGFGSSRVGRECVGEGARRSWVEEEVCLLPGEGMSQRPVGVRGAVGYGQNVPCLLSTSGGTGRNQTTKTSQKVVTLFRWFSDTRLQDAGPGPGLGSVCGSRPVFGRETGVG